jgi:hypothetical protein
MVIIDFQTLEKKPTIGISTKITNDKQTVFLAELSFQFNAVTLPT